MDKKVDQINRLLKALNLSANVWIDNDTGDEPMIVIAFDSGDEFYLYEDKCGWFLERAEYMAGTWSQPPDTEYIEMAKDCELDFALKQIFAYLTNNEVDAFFEREEDLEEERKIRRKLFAADSVVCRMLGGFLHMPNLATWKRIERLSGEL